MPRAPSLGGGKCPDFVEEEQLSVAGVELTPVASMHLHGASASLAARPRLCRASSALRTAGGAGPQVRRAWSGTEPACVRDVRVAHCLHISSTLLCLGCPGSVLRHVQAPGSHSGRRQSPWRVPGPGGLPDRLPVSGARGLRVCPLLCAWCFPCLSLSNAGDRLEARRFTGRR